MLNQPQTLAAPYNDQGVTTATGDRWHAMWSSGLWPTAQRSASAHGNLPSSPDVLRADSAVTPGGHHGVACRAAWVSLEALGDSLMASGGHALSGWRDGDCCEALAGPWRRARHPRGAGAGGMPLGLAHGGPTVDPYGGQALALVYTLVDRFGGKRSEVLD
jgi:hypothetical protein